MSDDSGKQGGNAAPFTAQDAMAFMQKMWNPFAMPMPGSASGAVTSVAEPQVAAAGARAAHAAAASAAPAMMPGMLAFPNPAAMFAALDPAEVARKIDELKIIEGWLAMTLNLTQMSIKALELQLASLEALHAARPSAKAPAEKRSRKS
jgi:hypothetical protein